MRQTSCVVLVTGATGAIGKAIAGQLAGHGGFEVVLGCRDTGKAQRAAREITAATGNPAVRAEHVDVSRLASIRDLATRWQGPLHVLINNAAQCPRRRGETPEGIELQFATNVLGYFRMALAFTPRLALSAPARIINVASYWAGDLDLSDPEFVRRCYNNDTAYRQSKQANRMLTRAFAERLAESGISVVSCHPGDVDSGLSRDLGFGGHETPDEAALTPVWLATAPEPASRNGNYFEHQREARCLFSANKQAVEELYRLCLSYHS